MAEGAARRGEAAQRSSTKRQQGIVEHDTCENMHVFEERVSETVDNKVDTSNVTEIITDRKIWRIEFPVTDTDSGEEGCGGKLMSVTETDSGIGEKIPLQTQILGF